MEFRCRLGTPGGEIIEGVYVADSEDRLRREFEEKGLYVLAIQRAGRLAFGSLALPTRSRIATREFLVFNQELATLLKAGMPLVQSLDILRRRVTQPVLQVGAQRRLRPRARGQLALGVVRSARRRSFPASTPHRCWPARRAATSSRSSAVTSPTSKWWRASVARSISALDLSGGPARAVADRRRRSWCCGSCRSLAATTSSSAASCRSRRA